ncbi:MAG: AzlC family ABC transporter permease [Oscillospiraceae bacterium]
MTHTRTINSFSKGIRDGIPIGLGYLSVSFAFGIMAVAGGLPVWTAVAISMTNLTSAGQVAGLGLIFSNGSFFQMALTQLVINMRYALMSLSLSQKLSSKITTADRFGISFGITDEIFAVASTQKGRIGRRYMYGLIVIPFIGWSLGTLIGALAGTIIPSSIQSALGIAIYGMFIAIIVPPSKESFAVLSVILVSVIMGCVFKWVPVINALPSGYAIIICAVIAATVGAIFFPVADEEENDV